MRFEHKIDSQYKSYYDFKKKNLWLNQSYSVDKTFNSLIPIETSSNNDNNYIMVEKK